MTWINDKNKAILLMILRIVLILAAAWLFLTKLLLFFAPFLVAMFITVLIEKPVGWMQKKFRFSRGAASAVALFAFIILAGGLIGFLFYRLLIEVWELASNNTYYQSIILRIRELVDLGGIWYAGLPAEVVTAIESSLEGILTKAGTTATSWINNLFQSMVSILTSLPQALLYTVITLVGTFFISRDRERISRFLYGQMPDRWRSKVRGLKDDLFAALIGYIKAILILVSIAFVEVLIGYTILGVRYSLFLAIVTAIADILPVLGPGTVLIPGAIIYLINGNYFLFTGFLILYILVTLVRQFLEPRIVGGSIGLHPLVTLFFIYLGFRLFGIVGLILGPAFAILLKSLQKAELLPAWKSY